MHTVLLWLCPALCEPVDCGLPHFFVGVGGRRFSKQESWSVLANTGCHTLLLLLLSRFSCVRFCATPLTAAQQALPSLGFSRQEHWSGLPFSFPMPESEKWKWSHTLLEHYISCFPSQQFPWVPGAARTPATQAAALPPHLVLMGADTSPPGKPQEQTPVATHMQRWK